MRCFTNFSLRGRWLKDRKREDVIIASKVPSYFFFFFFITLKPRVE